MSKIKDFSGTIQVVGNFQNPWIHLNFKHRNMVFSSKKIVVYDSNIPQLLNNKIFIPEEAVKVHSTILVSCYLYDEALKKGIQFVTPDVFAAMEEKPKKVLLVTHLISDFTEELIKQGVQPIILTCQESPFFASRFYLNFWKYSGWFKYSFVFSGMKKFLNPKSIYRQMFFPQSYKSMLWEPYKFKSKKLAVMVNGARNGKSYKKNLLLKLVYGLSIKEINNQRRKIIDFFGNKPGFDLYGKGWNKERFSDVSQEAVEKCYRGVIDPDKKNGIVANYKFNFCFENAEFPGYVTEKIFDAFAAGVVPIYLGAPDIYNFVTKGCFIDMRDFKSLDELYSFITNMKEDQYNEYIQNIKDFFMGEKYQRFSQEKFVKQILDILELEFENA